MPLCAFDENYPLMGVTPVENVFIQNFLPHANGDYVRVYLYGLMLCHAPDPGMTPERMAHFLDLGEDTVTSAFSYWERQGLVKRVSDDPPAYQYLSVQMSLSEESPMEKAVYRHRDFNNDLQKLFGTRLLHPADFQMACEWVEDMRLPEEVVLIMVGDAVEKKGQKLRFNLLNKTALEWAEKGIRTPKTAREYVARQSQAAVTAGKVLKQFGLQRQPTLDEVALARKWTETWRFTDGDIIAACRETTKARNPSFAYLDTILERNRPRSEADGAKPAPIDLDSRLRDTEAIRDAVKALYAALRHGGAVPSADDEAAYRSYLAAGFEPEAILHLAEAMGRERPEGYGMDRFNDQMAELLKKGLLTDTAMVVYLDRQTALRRQAEKIFQTCDYRSNVSAASAAQMEAWLDLAPYELILYAAERARGTRLPLQYITKLLREWKKAGVSTVDAAKAASPAAAAAAQAKVNPALQYSQRDYTAAEANDVYTSLDDDGEASHS